MKDCSNNGARGKSRIPIGDEFEFYWTNVKICALSAGVYCLLKV